MSKEINSSPIKEELWTKERQDLDLIIDACGVKIEDGIRDTLIVLRLLGLNTSSSCSGHIEDFDKGEEPRFPYVQIKAPNEPKLRFEKEEKLHEILATKYNLPLKDIYLAIYGGWGNDPRSDLLEKIHDDFLEITENYQETAEYKAWEEVGYFLNNRLQKYLDEFYVNRRVNPKIKISLRRGCLSGADKWRLGEREIEEKNTDLLQRLKDAQKEMQDFTEFLKKKYFEAP